MHSKIQSTHKFDNEVHDVHAIGGTVPESEFSFKYKSSERFVGNIAKTSIELCEQNQMHGHSTHNNEKLT